MIFFVAEPEFNGALDGKLCEAVDKESSIFVQSQENFEPVLDMSPGKDVGREFYDFTLRGPVCFKFLEVVGSHFQSLGVYLVEVGWT